jgi:hypothetical protein
VRNVRSLSLAASLAAVFIISNTVSSVAASTDYRPVNASRASNATPVPQQADAVPPNCIRQECGKLWCWQMKDGANPTTH